MVTGAVMTFVYFKGQKPLKNWLRKPLRTPTTRNLNFQNRQICEQWYCYHCKGNSLYFTDQKSYKVTVSNMLVRKLYNTSSDIPKQELIGTNSFLY